MTANLKVLARFTDSIGFVYLEHAVIEREDASIAAFTPDGRVSLPAASLSCLMLGPGTRITHAAVDALSRSGCVLIWTGEDGLRFYASGQSKTRSSSALERQVAAWASPERRLSTVRRLYQLRFAEPLPNTLTLQQIRGREGARVRDMYREASERFGVAWSGRSYERSDWSAADPVNRALSASNSLLYALCLAGLHAQGYSPALGFIHTGKQLSFAYDLADLFKADTTVPAAFEAAAEGEKGVERRARAKFRQYAYDSRLLDRITSALNRLFGSTENDDFAAQDAAAPGRLWDASGDVQGGRSYVGDDP